MKKVVIFGGSGFIGSHTADILTKKGYLVTIFDIKPSRYISPNQEMVIGDILNRNQVEQATEGVDFVYNFSGIANIDKCFEDHRAAVDYNIIGNLNILDACVKNKIRKFIFASSAYVYSDSGSFYRITKHSSEMFVEAYKEKFGLNYVIMRYGSLYGDRVGKENSIYNLCENAIKYNKIEYYGDGSEKREFIHVLDAAELSCKALHNEFKNSILLLTGDQAMSYKNLLEMINEILGNNIKITFHESKKNTHYKQSPYSFNPKLAKKLTNSPYIDLGQGLLSLIGDIYNKTNVDVENQFQFLKNKK